MKTSRGDSGQALIISVLLMLLALIFIPNLILLVQREARWSVKQSRSDKAYHLAEAGQDRGLWFLSFSTANWTAALEGITLSGYNFDKEYADIDGGTYKIKITSGPGTGKVTVESRGRDDKQSSVRAVSALYSGNIQLSGFVAQGAIEYEDDFTVYWGQVTSFTLIELDDADIYHPIKISGGGIDDWDEDPNPPNEDPAKNYETYVDLGEYPIVDFDYYRQKAKETRAPNPQDFGGKDGDRSAEWDGTGYFDGTKEVKWKDYTFDCSTCVFFLENSKAKIEKSGYLHLEGLIVYTKNIHIHNDGANPYTINVPTDAWKQYTAGTFVNPQSPDTAAVNEYPGDGGLGSVKPTYTIPNGGQSWPSTEPFDGEDNTGMSFHGFLYTNSFDCNGGKNSNVGQFMIGPGGTDISTMIIYFDPSAAAAVRYVRTPIKRISWDEVVREW